MSAQEQQMLQLSESMSKDISSALSTAPQSQEKFLGIIPPEATMVATAVFSGTFSVFSDTLREQFFKGANFIGAKAGLEGQKLTKVSAVSATALTAFAAMAPYIQPFFTTGKDQKKETVTAAKRVAPVLEELTGKHGIGAFSSIKAETNEVIYAHRKRISDRYGLRYTGNFTQLLSAAPEIGMKLFGFKSFVDKKMGVVPTPVAMPAEGHISANTVTAMLSGSVAPVLSTVVKGQKKAFDERVPAFTAFDMIIELEKQLSDDPTLSTYALPKGANKRPLPLAEYVAEIVRHHQLDMEVNDQEYTPIRKALDNSLKEISESIAEALKKGDISALSLVRLVGEGHIIKNKGRSLAKPSEVKVVLEKMCGNASSYTQVDPKEYFADAAFNKKELKEALDALEGEEKQTFAMMFPDSVLLEVGMNEGQVKELREATLSTYESNLGKIITGLASEDDKALHDLGLAKEEVKEIRAVAQKVKTKGEEAVNEVRSKPNNPVGIERLLAGAVVGQVLSGDRHYMGKLTSQAIESETQKTDHVEVAEGAEKSHAAKVTPNKKRAADHAERGSHAERQTARREGGSEQHEVSA